MMKDMMAMLSKRSSRIRLSGDLKKMLFHRFRRGSIVICAIGLVGMASIVVQHYGIIPLIKTIDSKKGMLSLKENASAQNAANALKNHTCAGFALKRDTDIAGGDLTNTKTESMEECCSICSNHTSCTAWSFVHSDSQCWVKSSVFTPSSKVNVTSGLKTQSSGIGGPEDFDSEIHRLKEESKEANAVDCCKDLFRYGSPTATGDNERPILWMDTPSGDFSSAFPIGNGRLGALLHFDPWKDRMELSFDAVWTGSPYHGEGCPDNLKMKPSELVPQATPTMKWTGPHQDKFIPGQVSNQKYTSLDEAKKACIEMATCGGLTSEGAAGTSWFLRGPGSQLNDSPSKEISWLLEGRTVKKEDDFFTFQNARKTAFQGNFGETEKLMDRLTAGAKLSSYEYLAQLDMDFRRLPFSDLKAYSRRLQLDNAVATSSFEIERKPSASDNNESTARDSHSIQSKHSRTAFASKPDEVLWVRQECVEKQQGCMAVDYMLTRTNQNLFNASLHSLVIDNKDEEYGFLKLHPLDLYANGYGNVGYFACAAILPEKNQAGFMKALPNRISVEGYQRVDVVIAAETRYSRDGDATLVDPQTLEGSCRAKLTRALSKGFSKVLESHKEDYSKLFGRTQLNLATAMNGSISSRSCDGSLTTPERVARYDRYCKKPSNSRSTKKERVRMVDTGLQQLFFDFGKYLLISSSREGGQPANLVGIWAEGERSPWNGDYHLNINMQMMYWAADILNLPETVEPLFPFMAKLAQNGKIAAECMYGSPGWVAHGFTDIWMNARPLGAPEWSMCPVCGAWMALHLYDSYRFNRDKSQLVEQTLPLLSGAVEFFLQYLIPAPDDSCLLSGPSHSPENSFKIDASFYQITMSPAIDTAVIFELFSAYLDGCLSLGCHEASQDDCQRAKCHLMSKANMTRSRLPNKGFPTVDAEGVLQEYYRWSKMRSHSVADQGHRHFSPLFSLFPGEQINRHESPELTAAARKLLDVKMSSGSGHTGWSSAWAGSLHARLGDGNGVQKMVDRMLGRFVMGNLLSTHPPLTSSVANCKTCFKEATMPINEIYWGMTGGTARNFIARDESKFQLDGNLGYLSLVAESLIQSRDRRCYCSPKAASSSANVTSAGARRVRRLRNLLNDRRRHRTRALLNASAQDGGNSSDLPSSVNVSTGLPIVSPPSDVPVINAPFSLNSTAESPSADKTAKQAGLHSGLLPMLLLPPWSFTKEQSKDQSQVEQPSCRCSHPSESVCEIDLLPAVPSDWSDGSVRGLRTRCGISVDMEWKHYKLVSATIRRYDKSSSPVKIRSRNGQLVQDTHKGSSLAKAFSWGWRQKSNIRIVGDEQDPTVTTILDLGQEAGDLTLIPSFKAS